MSENLKLYAELRKENFTMNTSDLMEDALNLSVNIYDGPRNNEQQLMCAQVSALLAIANELKRLNDRAEAEIYRADLLNRTID